MACLIFSESIAFSFQYNALRANKLRGFLYRKAVQFSLFKIGILSNDRFLRLCIFQEKRN